MFKNTIVAGSEDKNNVFLNISAQFNFPKRWGNTVFFQDFIFAFVFKLKKYIWGGVLCILRLKLLKVPKIFWSSLFLPLEIIIVGNEMVSLQGSKCFEPG